MFDTAQAWAMEVYRKADAEELSPVQRSLLFLLCAHQFIRLSLKNLGGSAFSTVYWILRTFMDKRHFMRWSQFYRCHMAAFDGAILTTMMGEARRAVLNPRGLDDVSYDAD